MSEEADGEATPLIEETPAAADDAVKEEGKEEATDVEAPNPTAEPALVADFVLVVRASQMRKKETVCDYIANKLKNAKRTLEVCASMRCARAPRSPPPAPRRRTRSRPRALTPHPRTRAQTRTRISG